MVIGLFLSFLGTNLSEILLNTSCTKNFLSLKLELSAPSLVLISDRTSSKSILTDNFKSNPTFFSLYDVFPVFSLKSSDIFTVVLLAALTRDDLTSASDTPTASKNALEVNISTTALDAVVDDNAFSLGAVTRPILTLPSGDCSKLRLSNLTNPFAASFVDAQKYPLSWNLIG